MSWRVLHGDCLERLRELDDCSVDAIVTDPPYGLGFMGREWDALPRICTRLVGGFCALIGPRSRSMVSRSASSFVRRSVSGRRLWPLFLLLVGNLILRCVLALCSVRIWQVKKPMEVLRERRTGKSRSDAATRG